MVVQMHWWLSVHQLRWQCPGSCPIAPSPVATGRATIYSLLLSHVRCCCYLRPSSEVSRVNTKACVFREPKPLPPGISFGAQAPTPEIKAAWVNEIRKVLTSQLQACRGKNVFGHHLLPAFAPGTFLQMSKAISKSVVCRSEGAGSSSSATRGRFVFSSQKPASTGPWSSPRVCLCQPRPTPGEGHVPVKRHSTGTVTVGVCTGPCHLNFLVVGLLCVCPVPPGGLTLWSHRLVGPSQWVSFKVLCLWPTPKQRPALDSQLITFCL